MCDIALYMGVSAAVIGLVQGGWVGQSLSISAKKLQNKKIEFLSGSQKPI
jgi:hypothetical protein